MFRRLYAIYDRRFVFSAPKLRGRTEREVWDVESPLLTEIVPGDSGFADLHARVGGNPGSNVDEVQFKPRCLRLIR